MVSPISHPRLLSDEDIRTEILQALADGLTGQVRVTFQKEKSLTLFIINGKVEQFYIGNHRAPDTNWNIPLFNYDQGELSIESMHPYGLMLKKILLEMNETARHQPASTSQLKTMFDLAVHNTDPTLFYIQWESAEGFVLVAGHDIPLRHAIMTTMNGSVEGLIAMDQITSWNEARCKVGVYRSNIQSQAWLEVHLNILFNHYSSLILNQYGQLTGKVMIRSIVWKIHTMSLHAGWNIEAQDNKLKDATVFSSAREAGDAYKQVITEIVAHIEPIIGHALTQNILLQTASTSKGVYKTIAETFNLLEVREASK